jgi:hypothetical protein
VVNELCKPAIRNSERYFIDVINPVAKIQVEDPDEYTYLLRIQDPVIKMLFSIMKTLGPQIKNLKMKQKMKEDLYAYAFFLKQKQKLSELERMQKMLYLPAPLEKKIDILERRNGICTEIIEKSLLMYKNDNGGFTEITRKIRKPTAFLVQYFQELNAGIKDFQAALEDKSKEDFSNNEISGIINKHIGELAMIEKYAQMLEKCKPYRGFNVLSKGEFTVSILNNENHEIISHKASIISLYRKPENENECYINPYLVVCIDFELESGGLTEEEAYEKLKESFDLYFRSMFGIDDNTESTLQVIKRRIEKKTLWKDTFNEINNIIKSKIIKNDQYQWKLISGDTNEQKNLCLQNQ